MIRIVLRPAFALAIVVCLLSAGPDATVSAWQIPSGFTRIFNGRNLDGWHVSRTNHHGTVGNYYVEDGLLLMRQHPFGQGGLLLTDRSYKDFELYLELNPDFGFNSGIFLRSSESGSSYQIEVLTSGDTTGNLIGERMRLSPPQYVGEKLPIANVWKEGDWNSIRVLMVGEAPHVTTWVNGTRLYELQMPKNDQIASVYGGMIGLQLHYSSSFTTAAQAGGFSGTSTRPWQLQRFRNLAVREVR